MTVSGKHELYLSVLGSEGAAYQIQPQFQARTLLLSFEKRDKII